MARRNGPVNLFAIVTLAVCGLALINPRFRQVCWSFLCKLR